MKLLAINGSGRKHGNTASLLVHCMENLPKDIEIQIIHLSELDFGGCIGCEGCAKTQTCVVKDDMMRLYPLIEEADGLILASPTYFYNITANMKAFIERLYPYEIFDPEDRHVWMSANEAVGIKYAMVLGVCEQVDVEDMGFTIEAMSMPLEALGYRVVNKTRILNCFAPKDIHKYEDAKEATLKGVTKLYKTIRLKEQQLNR